MNIYAYIYVCMHYIQENMNQTSTYLGEYACMFQYTGEYACIQLLIGQYTSNMHIYKQICIYLCIYRHTYMKK
jgi:hypothetical protein